MTASKSVLVIEDDAGIRNGLQELLELEGYQVQTAQNGLEGLEKLAHIGPCVVLLDLMMPVMDGYAFLQVAKTEKKIDSPVILITAAGRKAAFNTTADDVITKPIDIDRLLETVSRHCSALESKTKSAN